MWSRSGLMPSTRRSGSTSPTWSAGQPSARRSPSRRAWDSTMTQYFCASSRRRDEVRKVASLNGIDFIEVSPADQRTLFVHFIHPVSGLTKDNFRIVGGVRVRDVQVQALSSSVGDLVTLRVDRSGDFSTYTLQLATSTAVSEPPVGFDPMLAAVSFSFKVNCP